LTLATTVFQQPPPLSIRLLDPGDEELLLGTLSELSPESRYKRFGKTVVSPLEAVGWVRDLDGRDRLAVGACDSDRVVGVGRYVRLDVDGAEIAVTVVDRWQGRGVGRVLVATLVAHASSKGLRELRAFIASGNRPAVRLMRGIGGRRVGEQGAGLIEYAARLEPAAACLRRSSGA
jgi:GNAT superfamily N-acetyltransferase